MRYYEITFTNPDGSPVSKDSNIPSKFSSHSDTFVYNPGCLEVEFEITNAWGHLLAAQTHLRIHNPTIQMVNGMRAYNGTTCQIRGGFKKGLPLADPFQSGLIGVGVVQSCWANWLGTDLVLDFLLYPSADFGAPDLTWSVATGAGSPFPYSFQWGKGYNESLFDAIAQTFGYQGLTLTGQLNPMTNVVPDPPILDVRYTFQDFCEFIRKLSIGVVEPASVQGGSNTGQGTWQGYQGVSLFYQPNSDQVFAYDGTASPNVLQLYQSEFIGQPTWLNEQGALQSVHPMRSDVSLGFDLLYPKTIISNASPQNIAAVRNLFVNPGDHTLRVQQVRHVGRFRDTSPTGWVTYIDAVSAFSYNPNVPMPMPPEVVGTVTIEPLEQNPF